MMIPILSGKSPHETPSTTFCNGLDRISVCRDYSVHHGSGPVLTSPSRADGADAFETF